MSPRIPVPFCWLLAFTTAPFSAIAQSSETVTLSPFEVTAKENKGYIATNSISATRMRADIQTLPQSIQVVTSEFLTDVGAITITEALRYSSSVQPFGPVEGRFSLRGAFVTAVKRNGFQTSIEGISDMVFTDRVEVVKGPSSILYGLGGPGGNINIVTKKPTPRQIQSVKLKVDDNGAYRGEVDVSGPLGSKNFLYRVMLGYENTDTFVYLENNKRKAYGGSVAWQLTHSTKLSLDVNYLDFDSRELSLALPVNNARTDYIHLPRDWSLNGPNAFRHTNEANYWLTLDHTFSTHWYLRNYTQLYRQTNRFVRRNVDAALPGDTTINANSVARDFTNDNFISQTDLLYDTSGQTWKFQGLVGYVYDYRDSINKQWNQNGTAYPANPFPIYDYRLIPLSSPKFNLATNAFMGNPSLWTDGEITDNGFYGLVNFTGFSDKVVLFGGYRIDKVEQINADLLAGNARNSDSTFKVPMVGVSFTPIRPLTFYVAYSESSAANTNYPDNPQAGEGIDIGLKFSSPKGTVSGSIVVFDMELANIERQIPGQAGVTVLSGQETYNGVETDFFWQPIPSWSLIANYTYIDAIVSADTVSTAVGLPVASTPMHSANLWNKYNFGDGVFKGFFLGGGLNYRSEQSAFTPSLANYRVVTDGYVRYDLLLGWSGKVKGTRIDVRLNVNNVTDKTYIERGLRYGAPRTLVLTSSISF